MAIAEVAVRSRIGPELAVTRHHLNLANDILDFAPIGASIHIDGPTNGTWNATGKFQAGQPGRRRLTAGFNQGYPTGRLQLISFYDEFLHVG